MNSKGDAFIEILSSNSQVQFTVSSRILLENDSFVHKTSSSIVILLENGNSQFRRLSFSFLLLIMKYVVIIEIGMDLV